MSSKKSKSTVKIWFEGLPQPIPARAESVSDSQLLTVDLPYLRRNTQVFISDSDGESRKGYMTEVSLVSGPEPRLQILVQTGEPVFEPISELPLMSHTGKGLETVEVSDSPDFEALATSMDDRNSTIPLLTPLSEESEDDPSVEPASEGSLAPREFITRSSRDRRHEILTRLPAPPLELEKPPSRRWLGLFTLALVALAGCALYFHSGLNEPTLGVAEAAAKPADDPEPATPHRAIRAPAPAPAPVNVLPPEVEPPEESSPPEEARPPVDRNTPRVWLGKHPTLVIPIEGSTKGAESYALARPEGIAVNLPRAHVSVLKRQYKFEEGGFRLLNVWAKKGGVHLRVFFHGPKPAYKLHIDADAVRVTVYPSMKAPGK